MLKLRKWQEEAIPLALGALERGDAGVVSATTGAGKSIFLAELLRRWRETHPPGEGAVVVTTPSRKLVEQLSGTLAGVLGAHVVGRYYTRAKQDRREVIVCCNPSVPRLADALSTQGRPVAVWVADECHRTESPTMMSGGEEASDGDADVNGREMLARLNAGRRLGLTATPFRSEADERLTLFDRLVYQYPPAEALRDGVIVPWRIVPWGEERPDADVDDACVTLIRELGDRATRGPGVVNARTIEDAEAYAARLTREGIDARPIHSALTAAEQEANVAALRAGALDCLVHVSMLVEGVDYPWLRWGCLRRPVGARVRFIQEIGRFLRADAENPGKTEAVLLDPNNLFGAFQVTYEAALGWVEPEVEEEPGAPGEEELAEAAECDDEDAAGKPKPPAVVMAARTTALERYVRLLQLALIAEGVTEGASAFRGGAWRAGGPSEKQSGALRRLARLSKRLAADHREAVRKIVDTDGLLTKGLASDLIDLFHGVERLPGGATWTPASPVRVPVGAAFETVVDPVVYVAGGMKDGWAAIALVRGREVLYTRARPAQRGDRWVSLASAAAVLAVRQYGAVEVASSEPDVVASVRAPAVGRLAVRAENPAESVVWRTIRGAIEDARLEREGPTVGEQGRLALTGAQR